MSSRMRVLVAGTPEVAIPTLRSVAEHHDVVGVLTRPPARRTRRGAPEPSPLAKEAAALDLPVLEWRSLRTPEAAQALAAMDLDVAVVVAYGALVPAALLNVPRHGWINLHFSVLPAWRGAAPVQHALMHGDEVTGATTFRLTAGLDEGPVIGVMTERVRPRDTTGDLLDRLAHAGAPLVLRTLETLGDGTASPQDQEPDGVSLAPRIEVADAQVDFTRPARVIDRLIRAVTPAPGAWTTRADARIKLGPVRIVEHEGGLQPGEIEVTRTWVRVGTGTDVVELGEVAPQGKSWMAAADWARGARIAPGDALERRSTSDA